MLFKSLALHCESLPSFASTSLHLAALLRAVEKCLSSEVAVFREDPFLYVFWFGILLPCCEILIMLVLLKSELLWNLYVIGGRGEPA